MIPISSNVNKLLFGPSKCILVFDELLELATLAARVSCLTPKALLERSAKDLKFDNFRFAHGSYAAV